MNRYRWVRNSKTIVLFVLVAGSLLLSYFLWSGNLEEGEEIGFVQAPSLPIAATPDIAKAVRPYAITISTSQGQTVVNPDSSDYTYWSNQLHTAHTYASQTVKTLPKQLEMCVTFEFGISISHSLGTNWLSNFGSTVNAWSGREIVLYKLPDDNACRVALIGDSSIMTMKTDLNVSQLLQHADSNVKREPYDVVGEGSSISYVPQHLTMKTATYRVRQPDSLPLIHTFFVNPQATTRIQENAHTLLWTDGTRAVQWDKQQQTLQYEDPNGEQLAIHKNPFLAVIDFIQEHGGGASNVIGFDAVGALTSDADAYTYAFMQYENGFPILSPDADYDIDFENERVENYQRPMWVMQQPIHQSTVNIIDVNELKQVMAGLDKHDPLQNFKIVLGYAATPEGTTSMLLQPVYLVTNSSGDSFVINAVDGTPMPGSDIA
ncbi:two-component system activity regulator YycH [Alicyclobacillus fodiniaquatilis]|jgi:regulatory protein YycH of two-component signal transduction system YycFG|uniref:Two-component system activity regulator YycH n=1 Tax=Alicyclobacillus fodiniaquatilis TaxID=1661150 RepID=A0ABW4JHY7_9BACL